jgi:hypothetical protein
VQITVRATSSVRKNDYVRAIVSESLEAIPRACHNAFEH